MKQFLHKVYVYINHRKPLFALAAALCITLVLTTISMILYRVQGVAMLDFSRPGYEKARGQVEKISTKPNFSSTGSMDATTVDEFKAIYDSSLKDLKALGHYDSDSLNDEQLRVAAPDIAAPNP